MAVLFSASAGAVFGCAKVRQLKRGKERLAIFIFLLSYDDFPAGPGLAGFLHQNTKFNQES
jgi:hypothetical protein